MKGFLKEKIYTPLINHLANGVSPSKMALTMAIGIVCGICPMLWLPTLFCISFALVFRLNFPIMQLSNYATYPLHVVCMIPFYKTGAYFFNEEFNLSVSQIIQLAQNGVFAMIQKIGMSILHAVAAWAIAAPILVSLLYLILLPLVKRVALKIQAAKALNALEAQAEPTTILLKNAA